MEELDWNERSKRLLKSELVRRGVSNDELVFLLKEIGVDETKAGVDSKISRGTFSAAFLLQCLNAIGCKSLDPVLLESNLLEESRVNYKKMKLVNKSSN